MPCTLTGSIEGDLRYSLQCQNKDITELVQLLCSSCKLLEKNKIKMPKKLSKWFEYHKKIDKKSKK